MKKALLILSLLFAPMVAEAAVPQNVTPAVLSQLDKQSIMRIEYYLNGLKNVSADFLQVDSAGGMMRGQIMISRPGKIRVNYAPPSKDFIIADGSFVHIWDEELKSQTNVPQQSSLAHFILRDPVRLDGDVVVTKVRHLPSRIEVTLVEKEDPGAGSLTLIFEDRPMKLRQWRVADAQGRETGVNLENLSEGVNFPASTFVFIPPNFGKNK